MADAFAQWAPLGRYSRISNTLQLPWSALQDNFGDALRVLKDESGESSATVAAPDIISGVGFTCSSCNWEGIDVAELRAHCASDDHVDRIRLKVHKLKGHGNGSDSDEDSDGSQDDEWSDEEEIGETRATRWRRRIIDRVVFWERPKLVGHYGLAICSALLPADTDEDLNAAARKLLDPEPYWIIACLRSGNFAGAVFDAKTGEVVAHKSFHRYTVRAKAGGAQSTHDAGGKKPKSAGSSLRRYGEQRLEEEVVALFEKWKPYTKNGRIFASTSGQLRPLLLRAAGSYSRIPFMSTRVTISQTECLFAHLRVLHLTLPVVEAPRSAPSSQKPIIATKETVDNEGENSPLVYDEATDVRFGPLHCAARDGNKEDILRLLETEDPSLTDTKGRVPYYLCPNASIRDVFRRYCASDPTKWDWDAAKVEPLTDDMEERKRQKAKEKRQKQKERQKQQKQVEKQEQVENEERKRREEEERKGLPCANCSKLSGDKPFFRINNAYCSTACVQAHQRTLAAEAAMARFNK